MTCRRNLIRQFVKPGQVQTGAYESRCEVPGVGYAMGTEPVGDGFGPVAPSQVVELGRTLRRGLPICVQQMLPMFGVEIFAELAEQGLDFVGGLVHVRRRPTRRGGWIVQFV